MKQNKREKQIAFDLGSKAKRSSSETAVKVGSRATFPSQAVNVLVYKHTHTHIPHVYNIILGFTLLTWRLCFPPVGNGEYLSWRCFLVSERLYSFLLEGTVMVSPSLQPHLSPSGCFFPLLSSPPSSLLPVCVCLSRSLHLLPFLSWHLLSASLIILFLRFLIKILSFPLFLSIAVPFFVSPFQTNTSVQ